MKGIIKRLCTGFLALATMLTALPTTAVHAAEKQYWTTGKEKAGVIEKVMNDGSIGSTFNESWFVVEGETAYCIDINTDFISGYKTRADASTRMSDDQISDVALSLEYVKQYAKTHNNLNDKQVYLLEQCVVWQRLSVHLGWECDNVRASYDEIPKSVQDEVYTGAKAFVKENKGRYECGGYIYSGQGQELGQFWAKLAVGNATLKKASSNTSLTDGNKNYSLAGATYGVFSDKACNNQLATLTTDNSGNTETVEVTAGTVYIKELSAPTGFKVDKTVYSLKVEAGKIATLKVADVPKVTDISIELFKIDMETQLDASQGDASLAGAEFTWRYYDGYYNKDNLPAQPTRTWVTKTIAEQDSDGTTHYVTKLSDAYKVSGDSFYTQDGKTVLPLGTLTVEETKSPTGYLLEGAYLQADGSSEPIKGLYITQITEDGDLATLTGSNQYHVSDKVIRGGVKAQKRDLETGDTKPQGGATLKDTAFTITTLNDNAVLVEGKLYKKGEAVKTIYTGLDGIASTSADLLPYGRYELAEQTPPTGYLTDGAKPIQFEITENGKIVDLTDEAHSVYNQIKRGDIEGVKIGAGTHKRLADVPFRITSKTTGESHIIVTDDNGQFSTSADWASHKHDTNKGKDSEDGVWFGTSEPDDTKGALLYDTYIIEELRCESNKGFELIPPFEIVVSRNNVTVDLGTLTDEYEQEISIRTTATSKDGEKSIVVGKEVTIIDTVKLDGLKKGTKYQLVGWQMLKEDNTELLIDGERVENSYTFTADEKDMKIEMEYTFNASTLGGKDLVTFEELYDLTDKEEPVKVAEHKDIDDDGQTVSIEERIINIHTTATSTEGEKSLVAGNKVTIIDTVTLENLEIGTEYQLTGWQMLKEDNTELLINGERVESSYTFTADSEEMTVKMEYTFNASALGGKDLVTFEELYDLTDKDEPVKVAEHKDIEDDGQTVCIEERIINIHTTATDPEGEKSIVAGNKVTIIDTVTLENLEIGTEYQLTGWQMLKEDNTELLINGERVESSYPFTADSEEMTVKMEYTFNASALGGQNLVTFEELYDLTDKDEPVKVAEHKDIEDERQTVLVTERIITIHTTATDKDGNKELTADGEITLIDKVELDGLEIGATYQLVGWQMLKDKNKELLINGERVENSYTFTADSEHMEVEVAFTFDADGLDGKQLVTFEELYDMTDKEKPVKVAEHKDIEDKGQTVTFKEQPEIPEEPTEPQEPETPDTPTTSKPTDSPKTGDSTNIALFAGLLALSGAGIAGTYFLKKKKEKKS